MSKSPLKRRLDAGKPSERGLKAFSGNQERPYTLGGRVSHVDQAVRRHLEDQIFNLTDLTKEAECKVVGIFNHVGPGWDAAHLAPMLEYARKTNSIILYESVDRFLRHPGYHSVADPDLRPRDSDLEQLLMECEGLEFEFLVEPDSSPKEVRSYQRKRGLNKHGKEGRKKRLKEAMSGPAGEMRKAGMSLVEIARHLYLPRTTLRGWLGRTDL